MSILMLKFRVHQVVMMAALLGYMPLAWAWFPSAKEHAWRLHERGQLRHNHIAVKLNKFAVVVFNV